MVALIGGAIAYLLYRRRRANEAAEVAQDAPFSASLLPSYPATSQNLRAYVRIVSQKSCISTHELEYYQDPSDPSTFPLPLGQASKPGDSIQYSSGNSSGYPQTTVPARGTYNGVAEV